MNICISMTRRNLKLLVAFLFLLLFGKQLIASPQLPDYIIYKNDTIATYNLILEAYLQKPEEDKLFGLSFRNTLGSEGMSFNCWRGYQAIYEIENDSLFLSCIIECHSIRRIDRELSDKNLRTLFGNQVKNNRVFINWFSGDISFPSKSEDKKNEVIRWDGVFENIFLFETLISIDKGRIKHTKEIQNYIDNPNRINRKQNDKISKILFVRIQNYKWKELEDFDCSETYRVRINKKGRIDLVEMNLSKEDIDKFYEKDEYRHCIRSMQKALKCLKFDVIKRRGKPIEEYVYIEIWFEDDGSIENWSDDYDDDEEDLDD
jgi:hypothetical protein